jgi:pimeloyl-ACP methyl ester carboxylesterase
VDVFVALGHPVYVVDRPGHGRSRGGFGAEPVDESLAAQRAAALFAGEPADAPAHTQWPWPDDPAADEVRAIVASSVALPADPQAAQRREADLLIALLERTGPAVVVAHSLGACAVWVAAAERPELMSAVVALEPAGPPFASLPGGGSLTWGVSAVELPFSPTPAGGEELREQVEHSTLSALRRVPVRVVTAPASPLRAGAVAVADFLRTMGAPVQTIALTEHGIEGNGHGMMIEANSDEVTRFISTCILDATSAEIPR